MNNRLQAAKDSQKALQTQLDELRAEIQAEKIFRPETVRALLLAATTEKLKLNITGLLNTLLLLLGGTNRSSEGAFLPQGEPRGA